MPETGRTNIQILLYPANISYLLYPIFAPEFMGKSLHNRVNRNELRTKLSAAHQDRTTLSFYNYAHIDDPSGFRDQFYRRLDELGVMGRIYVAREGVNAQVSLPTENLESFRTYLNTIPFLANLRLNIAVEDDGKSFYKLTIKVKERIVADGIEDESFDVTQMGRHLKAAEFNTLTSSPDTILVDMRNHYESEVGHFENAITPPMETFREGLPMVADLLKDKKDKHIVMYCTGGIRCEKASAYMRHHGFEHVYQLEGGIIEYKRQIDAEGLPNKFKGKNFVFDDRLGERISEEVIATCHQCGKPCDTHVNCANDACHLLFVQCPYCKEAYEGCCSTVCAEFNHLPEEERIAQRAEKVFNGTYFSKSKPGMLNRGQ